MSLEQHLRSLQGRLEHSLDTVYVNADTFVAVLRRCGISDFSTSNKKMTHDLIIILKCPGLLCVGSIVAETNYM